MYEMYLLCDLPTEGRHVGDAMKMRFATQHKFSYNPPRETRCLKTRWGPVGTNGRASCVVRNSIFNMLDVITTNQIPRA